MLSLFLVLSAPLCMLCPDNCNREHILFTCGVETLPCLELKLKVHSDFRMQTFLSDIIFSQLRNTQEMFYCAHGLRYKSSSTNRIVIIADAESSLCSESSCSHMCLHGRCICPDDTGLTLGHDRRTCHGMSDISIIKCQYNMCTKVIIPSNNCYNYNKPRLI